MSDDHDIDDDLDDEKPATADDFLEVLKFVAERAGKVVLAHYVESENIEVTEKSDASPVTAADIDCEAFILEALSTMTPDIPIVSEEAASEGKIPDTKKGRFWLVDPLDGTKEFISRNGEFTVNIALIENGVPMGGVVHAPAMAMTWCGINDRRTDKRKATFSNTDQPPMEIHVRPMPKAGATLVASRRHGDEEEMNAFLAKKKITAKDRISAGSSLKFCLVASGKADLYPRFGRTMEWDTAAGQAVLEAAGGQVFTLDGKPLRYGKKDFENPYFYALGGTLIR